MVKIEKCEFGNIEIDGKAYGGKDLYIFWNGKIIERIKSHLFTKKEYLNLKGEEYEEIIIASGFYNALKVEREVFNLAKKDKKEITILNTEEACKKFNESIKEGKKVVLVLHSTC